MRVIKDQTVRLWDYADDEGIIHDIRFEDCEVLGPAVVFHRPGKVALDDCFFDGTSDGIIWAVPEGRMFLTGAYGTSGCGFTRCTFVGIGLAMRERDIPKFLDDFQPSSS